MAHKLLREQAIQLRLKGYTFGQIKRELGISKSTLSGWLQNYPLNEERLKEVLAVRDHNRDIAVERFRNTLKEKRLARLKDTYSVQQKKLLPLTERELFLSGLFLYWGEGCKKRGRFSISNTDPRIVKFSLFWMTTIIKIPIGKIKISLHLYKDMNVKDSIDFWANFLNFPIDQFAKPYIKKSNIENLTYKNFGHGTCNLYCHSVEISEKIAMSLKAISDYYGAKDDIFWYN